MATARAKNDLKPYIEKTEKAIASMNVGVGTIIQQAATGEGKFASDISQSNIQEWVNEFGHTNVSREVLNNQLTAYFGVGSIEELAESWDISVEQLYTRFEEVGEAAAAFNELYANSAEDVRNYYEMLMSNEDVKEIFDDMKI